MKKTREDEDPQGGSFLPKKKSHDALSLPEVLLTSLNNRKAPSQPPTPTM